jgi:hypothetical protein
MLPAREAPPMRDRELQQSRCQATEDEEDVSERRSTGRARPTMQLLDRLARKFGGSRQVAGAAIC